MILCFSRPASDCKSRTHNTQDCKHRITTPKSFWDYNYICIAFHSAAWLCALTPTSFAVTLLGHDIRASLGQTKEMSVLWIPHAHLPTVLVGSAQCHHPWTSWECTDVVYHKGTWFVHAAVLQVRASVHVGACVRGPTSCNGITIIICI